MQHEAIYAHVVTPELIMGAVTVFGVARDGPTKVAKVTSDLVITAGMRDGLQIAVAALGEFLVNPG